MFPKEELADIIFNLEVYIKNFEQSLDLPREKEWHGVRIFLRKTLNELKAIKIE
jgi:hypothetical protein